MESEFLIYLTTRITMIRRVLPPPPTRLAGRPRAISKQLKIMAKKNETKSKPAVPSAPAAPAKPAVPAAPANAAAPVKPAAVAALAKIAKPARKTATAKKKPPVAKAKAAPKPAKPAVPTYTRDDIALRAYFISEKRQAHGLPGDEHHDWIEAERQLAEESKKPKKAVKA